MEKRPFDFEDVEFRVDNIRNLVEIYDDLVTDKSLESPCFSARNILEFLEKYNSIIWAVRCTLGDLSDGVKTTLEIDEQACERKAVR